MKQKILDVTRNGLDIILYYYPQAQDVLEKKNKHFKIRSSEATASASIMEIKGMWRVTDFGDSATARSPFDIAMEIENLPFNQTIFLLAQRYGVDSRIRAEINKPKITHRKALGTESDGDFTYVVKDEFTAAELQCLGPFVKDTTCAKYSYQALVSYSMTKPSKTGELNTTTIESTDSYPIFMRDCGEFQKIYKPMEPDKAFRFFYRGNKPRCFINGLAELQAAWSKFVADQELAESKPPRKTKLPEAIFCSGERDALNIAGMGYFPLWLNSESESLSESDFATISKMVERIYNIPDIDETGIRRGRDFALRHLDLYTIELPVWLTSYKDNRGKPRKDVRDFLELRPNNNEFRKLLNTAKSCKFWDIRPTDKGVKQEINTEYLLHYLKYNGFAKVEDELSKIDRCVRINAYKVEEFTPKQIRAFIYADLRNRHIDTQVINLFLNSKRTSSSLADDLIPVALNFSKYDERSRTFFFDNCSVRVEETKIVETRNPDISNYTWKDNVAQHHFKELPAAFTFNFDTTSGLVDFEIKHTQSHLFRFLINASRIYWREEFEQRQSPVVEENEAYQNDYKFSILGPRLTPKEQTEQYHHLLSKVFIIGYLLHRYKSPDRAWAVWIMENRLTEANQSSGGSGKSFFMEALQSLGLTNKVFISGRDKKVTDNKHFLDRVSSNTDILHIDDADRNLDFYFFYTMITGNTTVNPKGDKSFEIKFKESPNIVFTSNFPPPNDEDSTMRRMLPFVMSDYYHTKTDKNDYLETRKIANDFGMPLFQENYTPEWYNEDINFCVNCLQFYLHLTRHQQVMMPPMENVYKRMNIATMGYNFKEWAESYFDDDNLNIIIKKHEALNDFMNHTGITKWSTQKFTKALEAYCQNNNIELNPRELLNSQGRLVRKDNYRTVECIYLRTQPEINDKLKLL